MEFTKDNFIEILRSLVRIESPYFHEDEIMDFVCDWLNSYGVPARIHEYCDSKVTGFRGKNVVGIIDSGKDGPSVFLGGHLDTVMLCDGWTRPPFEGLVEGDRMYGVGTVDMKAGDAAVMMCLVKAVEESRKGNLRGKIHFQFASVEEGPFGLGTMFYLNDNVDGIANGVDFAVIAEPSAGFTGYPFPCICPGARGGYNYTIKVRGKSAHAAMAEMGTNAVVDASRIVCQLENLPSPFDEKLGKSTPCVIRMGGGGAACSVPDSCEIEIFHHTVRGESEETIKERVRKAVEQAGVASEVELCFRESPCEGFGGGFDAYCTDEDNPYLQSLTKAIEESSDSRVSTAYFQSIGDFNHFGGQLKVPTVLFGPTGKGFHGPDEYVDLSSAWETARSLSRFLAYVMS